MSIEKITELKQTILELTHQITMQLEDEALQTIEETNELMKHRFDLLTRLFALMQRDAELQSFVLQVQEKDNYIRDSIAKNKKNIHDALLNLNRLSIYHE